MSRAAIFTVIHPGILRFVRAWAASAAAQTATADVVALLHGVTETEARAAAGKLGMETVVVDPALSIAEVRNLGLAQLAAAHDVIVCVDADDELEPDRVARAIASLEHADVSACAMRIVDAAGRDTRARFTAPLEAGPLGWIVGRNVFGLSNTAYRASALRAALPAPADIVTVDWFLATMAAASGARLAFEPRDGMRYRRYGGNLAPLGPPYTAGDVRTAFERVLTHYGAVRRAAPRDSAVTAAVVDEEARVRRIFSKLDEREPLESYTEELNRLPPSWGWWSHVADPRVGQGNA